MGMRQALPEPIHGDASDIAAAAVTPLGTTPIAAPIASFATPILIPTPTPIEAFR